jgi:hypothetical protein
VAWLPNQQDADSYCNHEEQSSSATNRLFKFFLKVFNVNDSISDAANSDDAA